MTMASRFRVILGTTRLLFVLSGTVYLLIAGHVPRWFAVLQVMVAGGFVVRAVVADRREGEP